MVPSTPTKHPQKSRRAIYGFLHSTWITTGWDWFLELVGRAAEAILVLSVLYSSVKLLPVVHMPAALDVVVFIAQFVALDVGGLSLGKLAKQARAAGNEEGATQAGRMSTALITIMIAGVVVVALEQLFTIPGNWKLGIDTALLIARSILAVLYGHIIHSVKVDDLNDLDQSAMTPLAPVVHGPPVPTELLIDQALKRWQTEQNRRFDELHASLAESESEAIVRQCEAASEAKMRQMVASLEASYEAKYAALVRQQEALVRQRVTVSEAPQTRQIEAPTRRSEVPHKAPQNVLPMRQTNPASADRRSTVYRLVDGPEQLSSYAIAARTGVPVSTVQRYLKDRREAESEATGTGK